MARKHSGRRARRRQKIRIVPGAAPGSIQLDPKAPKPVIRAIGYGPGGIVEKQVDDLNELRSLRERWPVLWVDVNGVGDAATIDHLTQEFDLHALAVEDVVNVGQRAKVDPYDDHLFVVLSMPSEAAPGYTEQVSLFLGEGFVLTFQERAGDCFEPVRERIRVGKGRIRKAGPDYLAYALIDAVVDSYFPLLDRLGTQLEELEGFVLRATGREIPELFQRIRVELREIQRVNMPHRDLLSALLRPDVALVREDTRLFLRDSLDHAVRISEVVDGYREESSDLMNLHLSNLSNRMNEIMKVLTIMAAIFIPLSFVAGVYGMNFDPDASPWNMPELGWRWGYPAVLFLMLAISAGLLTFFRRKKWI
jgi:magnesium transporter